MSERFITQWFYCAVRTRTVTEKKGLFRKKKEREQYDMHMPDFDDYANHLAAQYNNLDQLGYDVVDVVPINIGTSEPCWGEVDNGVGRGKRRVFLGRTPYSTTRGAMVVGRRRDQQQGNG